MRPLTLLRFARAIGRSVSRGDVFPPAGRVPPAPAPGGSAPRARRWWPGNELAPPVQIEQTEHSLPLPGLSRPIRLLHITDTHLRGLDAWAEDLSRTVAALRPDLLVLTGDILTRGYTPDALHRFLGALPPAPLGRFSVIGNWERWGGCPASEWRRYCEAHGVRYLQDEAVDMGGWWLVGLDDALSGDPDLDAAFAPVPPGAPCVALTHSPALFPRIARPGVRLVLAGHTHGGQVKLPLLGPLFLPRGSGPYPWGWYTLDDTHLFVSRGIGWSVAPIRWQAPPELAWITLTPSP